MAVDSMASNDESAVDKYDSESEEKTKPSSSKKKRKRTTSSGGESILANASIKKSPVKAKKKKKAKDVNAPHKPLNPYVIFLNKTRESVRVAHPGLSFQDLTKLLANQWTSMDESAKKPYVELAAEDRERYLKEVSVYQSTDNYRIFQETKNQSKSDEKPKGSKKSKEKSDTAAKKHKSRKKKKDRKRSFSPLPEFKVKKSSKSSANDADAKPTIEASDIPIFTEAFLDHNKLQESELRRLRKQTMDYEEANAILSKHIDNVSATGNKVSDEISKLKENNKMITDHLNQLKKSLFTLFTSNSFSLVDTFISSHNNGSPLTLDNMEHLIQFIESKLSSQENSGTSSNKENSLLREKLAQLLGSLCKKENDSCTGTNKSQS